MSEMPQFKRVRTIGSGAFGCVELCTLHGDRHYGEKGELVAVKRLKDVSCAEVAKKEAMVLKNLSNRFIVTYMDNFKDAQGQFYIVMEYCDFGTLKDWLSFRKVKPIEEYNIWRMVWQFATALSFLHSRHPPILHNDLKPANVLCKYNNIKGFGGIDIKIADFGVCYVLGKISLDLDLMLIGLYWPGKTPSAMYYHASRVRGGTVCYLAPEVLQASPHVTTGADMWSLGALLAYVANDREHLFRTSRDVLSWEGVKSPLTRKFQSNELHVLVLSLLSIDKHGRPSADCVLQDSEIHRERRENLRDSKERQGNLNITI